MPPPHDFVLFLDENHCNNQHLLEVLRENKVAHERYISHFLPGESDIVWLPIIGERNWCLLTTDKRIRYRALEKEAVRSNNVRMYCFSTNKHSGRQIAGILEKALSSMFRLFLRQKPPFIAMITRNGTVHVKQDFT